MNIDLNKRTTKQSVIDTAIRLFSERGYHQSTMDAIATACNIKKPTLYHHIVNREDLVLMVLNKVHENFQTSVLNIVNQSELTPIKQWQLFFLNLKEFLLHHPEGAIFAKLSVEIPPKVTLVHSKITEFFHEWESALTQLINKTKQHSIAIPSLRPKNFICEIQGMMLLDKVVDKAQMVTTKLDELMALEDKMNVAEEAVL